MIKSHFFTLAFVYLSTCLFADKKVGEGRPNVLLISIDDLNDWIGCLGGHPQARLRISTDWLPVVCFLIMPIARHRCAIHRGPV